MEESFTLSNDELERIKSRLEEQDDEISALKNQLEKSKVARSTINSELEIEIGKMSVIMQEKEKLESVVKALLEKSQEEQKEKNNISSQMIHLRNELALAATQLHKRSTRVNKLDEAEKKETHNLPAQTVNNQIVLENLKNEFESKETIYQSQLTRLKDELVQERIASSSYLNANSLLNKDLESAQRDLATQRKMGVRNAEIEVAYEDTKDIIILQLKQANDRITILQAFVRKFLLHIAVITFLAIILSGIICIFY